jgi:glycosyltransferase involved in cell wall biosynthesis
MATLKVVCCAEMVDPKWRWVESYFSPVDVAFDFARCPPHRIDKVIRVFSLARFLGCLEAVRTAQRTGAQILVTHGPTLAAWCSLLARVLCVKASILAHSFNFTALPGPVKRIVFRFAFASVERFVVFSQIERDIYSRAFNVPIERFDFVHWSVRAPNVEAPHQPIERGDYIAAIGGNARDYKTLVEAAHHLQDVHFVLVVRPENLKGLELPTNVTVYTDISFGKAMNILLHSRFMVLPLIASDIPCGHVTLVAAMHLGKAMVVTNSAGVRDYICEGENAITVEAGSVGGLIEAMRALWQDREMCDRLGETGKTFAATNCTEERIADHFRNYLVEHQTRFGV